MPPKKRGASTATEMITLEDEPVAKKTGKESGSWSEVDDGKVLVYSPNGMSGRAAIAGFDIDFTIISTKSGRTFAKDENDWQFLMTQVPSKLNEAYEKKNMKIVFFTNQKGISLGKQPIQGFKNKVEAILAKIRSPVQVFVATSGASKYRKPYTGMWTLMEEEYNQGIECNRDNSFFVGDAAGRPARGKIKKDFTCSDRLFAANLKVKFYTPEEHFADNGIDNNFTMPHFNSSTYIDSAASLPLLQDAMAEVTSPIGKPTEMIVMVGSPASGKSTFVTSHLTPAGYVHISRDSLKTWQKCVAAADDALAKGKPVVVDNTNPDVESRKRYIDVAAKHKCPCRAFVMNVEQAHAAHNNRYRLLIGADAEHLAVNDMVMRMFWSKMVKPTPPEGFSQVVNVNFLPKFANVTQEEAYRMWLVEK